MHKELFPKNLPQVTEEEARRACQDAKNLRRELAGISANLAALDKARRLATFALQIAEQRVALWEAQETEVKKLGSKGHGRYKESAQRRERELENRLRVALGLKPLEAGQEGLK